MTVDPAAPMAHRRHGERDFYFSGATCAEAFDANPDHHFPLSPMNRSSRAPTDAGDRPPVREGERFERATRVVTIKVGLPEISIHEIEFDPTFEVPPHTHDHVDAMLVLDGEIELLGDMVAELAPEPSSLTPPGPSTASANHVPGARGS
jgi:hypothetical protein